MSNAKRNDPCPCGSGKKYKQCCLKRDEAAASSVRAESVSIPKAIQTALEYQQTGRLAEAETIYRRILQVEPNQADALHLLGLTAHQRGNNELAHDLICRAIRSRPRVADFHSNLGAVCIALGRVDEAAESYRKALALKQDFPEAHFNLANVLKEQGRLDEAASGYRKAIALKPDYADAHNNLGNVLKDCGKLEEADACYRKAIARRPEFAEAHNNLGNVLKDCGKLDEAAACYRNALTLKPDYPEAYNNLGNALKDIGRLDEAVGCFHKALALKPAYANAYSNLLFTLNFDPRVSGEEIYRVAREYEVKVGLPQRASWRAHDNDRSVERRLRLGYVSADFCKHAVAYFAEPILANHDKSKVEVFCYSGVRLEDEVTSRFRQLADHWHSTVGLSDEAMAQLIRQHQIDILVDLAGHTAGNRLPVFARKPAPVQISYLGYPGTTGLSAIDYRITDRYADPEGSDAYYSEKLLRLPDSLCCYRPVPGMPEMAPLPALQNGYITFGSLNNFNKVNDQCIELWAEVLRSAPASRLLMLTVPEGAVREQLKQKFAALGVRPDRLELYGKFPPAEFQRMFQRVDIAFDPFPVTGGTTTCEALWMGVPVIVLVGQRFISRVGYSFLRAAGLHDFAVDTREGYVGVATRLANDIPLLSDMHDNLRNRLAASPLTDVAALTRNLEGLYREVWGVWCRTDAQAEAGPATGL